MIFKMSEWESGGTWHVANTDDLAHGSAQWWWPARMLNISLTDFILLLKDKYHAKNFQFFSYPPQDKRNSLLLYSFDNYTDAHKFLLDMNREARKRKFVINK
jgi:hypothetical protein